MSKIQNGVLAMFGLGLLAIQSYAQQLSFSPSSDGGAHHLAPASPADAGGATPRGPVGIYQLDDGETDISFGGGVGELCWIHAFSAQPGYRRIVSVSTAWSHYATNGAPGRIFVWEDPNDDGNPTDAVLLHAQSVSVQNACPGSPSVCPVVEYMLTSPVLVSGGFFVGASTEMGGTWVVAVDRDSGHPLGTVWYRDSGGVFNPNDLSGARDFNVDFGGNGGVFLLRALGAKTAISYQGQLTLSGTPVDGTADVQFTLFDASTGGTQIGATHSLSGVTVANGLFTVEIPFSELDFNGAPRWIEVAVSYPQGGAFATLAPRQSVTPTPYAFHAQSVANVPWSSVTGIPVGFADGADDIGPRNSLDASDGSPTNAVYVDSVGKVGIGTISPSAKLHIAGVAGADGVKFPDSTLQTTAFFGLAGNGTATTAAHSDHHHNALASSDGSELNALFVDSLGNIGIGSTVPDEKLEIVDTLVGGLTCPLKLENAGASTNGTAVGLLFQADAGADRGKGAIAYERTTTWNRGKFHFLQNSATDATLANLPDAVMTIDNNGFVGLGTTAPVARLHVAGDSFWINGTDTGGLVAAAGAGLRIANGSTDSAIFAYDYATNANRNLTLQNTGVGGGGKVGIARVPATNTLEVEGNASKTTAGSWLANSDRRIKQDIATIGGALATLDKLRLVSFRYNDAYRSVHPAIEDRTYFNVIAQEFAEVFPEWVKPSGESLPDGSQILQVDAYPITIYTAAAVQELHAELRERDERIADLEARLARLERAMETRPGAAGACR